MLFQDPGMSGRFMKQVRPQWPLNRTTKVVLDIKNALPELWSRSCGYIKCLYRNVKMVIREEHLLW